MITPIDFVYNIFRLGTEAQQETPPPDIPEIPHHRISPKLRSVDFCNIFTPDSNTFVYTIAKTLLSKAVTQIWAFRAFVQDQTHKK